MFPLQGSIVLLDLNVNNNLYSDLHCQAIMCVSKYLSVCMTWGKNVKRKHAWAVVKGTTMKAMGLIPQN